MRIAGNCQSQKFSRKKGAKGAECIYSKSIKSMSKQHSPYDKGKTFFVLYHTLLAIFAPLCGHLFRQCVLFDFEPWRAEINQQSMFNMTCAQITPWAEIGKGSFVAATDDGDHANLSILLQASSSTVSSFA